MPSRSTLHRPACAGRGIRWRDWVLTLALATLALGAAAAPPLVLGVSRTPLSLPLYVAQAEGFFAAEGLELRIVECVGGIRCMSLLQDGKVDVATMSDTPVMFGAFAGGEFAVISTLVTSTDDLAVIGRKASGITTTADLAGKTVGVVARSASHYFLDVLLLTDGVDPRSVRLHSLAPDAMAAALRIGMVDAVSAWEPYVHEIRQAQAQQVVVLPNRGVYRIAFNLVAGRGVAGTRDAQLIALLRALERAQVLIREQPQRARAILRARLGTDEAFVQAVWAHLQFRLSLDQALLKTLESQARWALRAGHVQGAMPNYLKFIHPAPLLAVKPAAVTLRP